MITLKSCKRDGQRLAITLAEGDNRAEVYLGPQSVGSAFIQQESNAKELAKVIVEAVNALVAKPRSDAEVFAAAERGMKKAISLVDAVNSLGSVERIVPPPAPAETEPVVVPAKPTKRSGK